MSGHARSHLSTIRRFTLPASLAPRLAVAVILFSLYLISGAGNFHIIDEVSLYSVTENLARRGSWDTDQIVWSQWVNSPAEVLGAWGQDGHVYSKKGVAPALAFLPLRFLAGFIPGVGLLQTTFLSNALITIVTALLLWSIAKRLGYGERLGAAVALVFGLSTLAWPYATHLFGEPLSALCLTAALWGLIVWRQQGGWRPVGIMGLALGIAVGASALYALVVPLFGLTWLGIAWRERRRLPEPGHWLALGLPLLLCAIFLLLYNDLRFGNPLDTGYHFTTGEGFNGRLLSGLYGLLLSPYRGIVYHQPLTLLALAGFVMVWRRHREIALLTGSISLLLVVAFAKWWIWWGGFAWGPRFLAPLAPYLTLWLLPLLAEKRRWWLWAVLALSTLVQVLAVSANYVLWEIELRGIYPTDWQDPLLYGAPATHNPLHSPVFGQIYLLARGQWAEILDFAWYQPNGVHWWIPLLGLGMGGIAAWLLYRWRRGRPMPWAALALTVALLPFTYLSLTAYAQSARYGSEGRGYAAILDEISRNARPGDALVTVAPYHYHIPMNRYNGALPIVGLAQEPVLHPESERLLEDTLASAGTIYLVTAGLPPADASNGVELWLNDHAYLASDQWYDDFRLLRYGTQEPVMPLQAGQIWGDPPLLRLTEATISSAQVQPGTVLSLALHWEPQDRLPALRLFVQLLPTGGPPVAQRDVSYATDQWSPRDAQSTRLGLWLAPDIPPGAYALIVGWYDPATGQRLVLPGQQGDYATLGMVEILGPR